MSNETPYRIHSRPSGPHWIAWVSVGESDRPVDSVILVGQTREDAEERARAWAEQIARRAARPAA